MNDLLEKIQPYTKSSKARLISMVDSLRVVDANNIFGDIVECGVWKGGNIILSRLLSPKRYCWLYDTFTGMTVPDKELDHKKDGERAFDRYIKKKVAGQEWDAVSLEEVRQNFRDVGLEPDDCSFVQGPVEKTLSEGSKPEYIAILRLDTDWYSSTKAAMKFLFPKIVRGGYLIVDDYGHWMGCKRAIDEYFGKRPPPHYDSDYSCRVFRC